jgi:hypothetical protein
VSSIIINKINELEKQRSCLLTALLQETSFIKGSYSQVHRRCGKPYCWCTNPEVKGHPYDRVTWTELGQSKIKAVPKDLLDWVIIETKKYKQFKKLRRKLRLLDEKINSMLYKYEDFVISKTKKAKNFL